MPLPEQTQLLRRLLVGLALFGIVLVTHLSLQKAGGFEDGCLGLGADLTAGAATTGTTAGCAAVTESEYADFLGISNIALGLIFYVVVAGLRLGYAVLDDERLRLASLGVVSVGMAYTVYLVYLQAAVIGSFCPLCMTSAALVLLLFILTLVEHMRLKSAPPVVADDSPRRRRRAAAQTSVSGALRPYLTILGGFAVLLFGAFAIAPEAEEQDLSAVAGPVGPTRIEQVTGACEYDPEYQPLGDMSALMTGPTLGNGPTPVVKVFDPNCPHCRALSETIDSVIPEASDAATFYYVPYPLRQQSLGQVVALTVAQDEGRFFDLMHEMFRRQDASWGMTQDELVETVTAVGMDGAAFSALLEDEAQLQPILDRIKVQADAVVANFAKEDGGLSVPKLAIGGRVIAPSYASYSPRCLTDFIARGPASADAPDDSATDVQ